MEKHFYISDWYTQDEEVEDLNRFVIYAFGLDITGKNVSIKITSFTPYFYIEVPAAWKDLKLRTLEKYFISKNKYLEEELVKVEYLSRFRFKGYHWGKRRHFVKWVFTSHKSMMIASKFFENKTHNIREFQLTNHKFPVYESNIDPILRFFHLVDIEPCSWIKIINCNPSLHSNYQGSYSTRWKNISKSIEYDQAAKLTICSFDIEADSSHGDFPLAKKDYTKLSLNIVDAKIAEEKKGKTIYTANITNWLVYVFSKKASEEEPDVTKIPKEILNQKVYTKKKVKINRTKFGDIALEILNHLYKLDSKNKKEIVNIICELLNNTFPKIQGDKVIQIGSVFRQQGSEKDESYLITLDGCSAIEGINVESYDNEKEVIIAWAQLIRNKRPSILTGYNINGFDFKFLWDRAEECGCEQELEDISDMIGFESKLIEKQLVSSGLGENVLYYPDVPGLVIIDLLKIMQRDFKLPSYKLENVASEFIYGKILKIHNKNGLKIDTDSIFSLKNGDYIVINKATRIGIEAVTHKLQIIGLDSENKTIEVSTNNTIDVDQLSNNDKLTWGLVKDDVSPQDIFNFQKGSDNQRAIIGKYCIQDCVLCLNIMDKIMIMPNNVGMCNVCLVPLSFIFLRGQMIKALSLVSKFCREAKFLLPVLPRIDPDAPKESFEGAVVLEPKPAIYSKNPVAVVDYGSLYPSSMIAENISHDTHVLEEKYLGDEGAEKLRTLGLDYVDITYDNYLSEMRGKQIVKKLHPTIPTVTCRFIQPAKNLNGEIDNSDRAILPQILLKLLGSRKATKKLMEKETDPLKKSILDGLQLAYKLTANSLYGAIGARVSKIYFPEGAASTTATGRNMLMLAKNYVENTFPKAKIVYGDSVTGDTPILVKINGRFRIITIDDLFYKIEEKSEIIKSDNGKEYINTSNNQQLKVWTDKGFTSIKNIVRHKVNKPIIRVITNSSCVDVTEDHSLLTNDGTIVSPKNIKLGDSLMTAWPSKPLQNDNNSDIGDIIFQPKSKRLKYLHELDLSLIGGKFMTTNKLQAARIYLLLKSLNLYPRIDNVFLNQYIIGYGTINNNCDSKITTIKNLKNNHQDLYVYDLTTENHHFQAGIGEGIVHNTDSIFIDFNENIEDKAAAIKRAIELGIEVEKGIQPLLKKPHKLEYEKTFFPFCLFSKKRYVGNKYEFDDKKYKMNSMGLVTKRRDNAPIVKYIYGRIIEIIMEDGDMQKAIQFLLETLNELEIGKFDIKYFIISKTLKGSYANPDQIVHKVLADRIALRDPGNAPKPNDRLPYVFIHTKNPPKLQGDRAEHPDYVESNKLKINYVFYIVNQIMKPICQIFALDLDSLRPYGYKKHSGYIDEIEEGLRLKNLEASKIRDKMMKFKMGIVEKVFFQEYIRKEDNDRKGNREITNFFIRSEKKLPELGFLDQPLCKIVDNIEGIAETKGGDNFDEGEIDL